LLKHIEILATLKEHKYHTAKRNLFLTETYLQHLRLLSIFMIVIAACSLSLYLIWRNTIQSSSTLNWENWKFFEWLINYQGGFVRRGLIGEVIHRYFYEKEIQAVNYLVFVLGGMFVVFSSAIALTLKDSAQATLLYIFAPTGYFGIIVSNQYYYNREMFFYVSLFVVTFLFLSWRKYHLSILRIAILVMIGASSMVLPLIHEGFLFFCGLYFSLVLNAVLKEWLDSKQSRMVLWSFVGFHIAVVAVLAMSKGNGSQALNIWSSLSVTAKTFIANGEMSGAIGAIGWSLVGGLSKSVRAILSGLGMYYVLPLALVFLIVGYIHSCVRGIDLWLTYQNPKFWANFSTVCLTFFPLFVFGDDFGRWIVGIFVVFSSMIISDLTVPLPENISNACIPSEQSRKRIYFCTLLLISLLTIIPECCIGRSHGINKSYWAFIQNKILYFKNN
jgi:hypothetical protein